jgi:hypothetical protein
MLLLTLVKLFESKLMREVMSRMLVIITKRIINGGPRIGDICRGVSRYCHKIDAGLQRYLSHSILNAGVS